MSTSPYSQDLRDKVIAYINRGHKQRGAVRVFNIHKNTVSRWWNRHCEEGNCKARIRSGYKSKVNKEALADYVTNHPNSRLTETGKRYGITGAQAGNLLKQIGFSYKKKPFGMWKRIKQNENPI